MLKHWRDVACDMLTGLAAIHEQGWTHRGLYWHIAYHNYTYCVRVDIKLENVIIMSDGRAKIIDFEFSRPDNIRHAENCGSELYAAPEVYNATEFARYEGKAADCWSAGV